MIYFLVPLLFIEIGNIAEDYDIAVSLRNLLYSVLVDQLIISPSEVIASSS
jgi:hypothetical protein